jgi:hypothetical protein
LQPIKSTHLNIILFACLSSILLFSLTFLTFSLVQSPENDPEATQKALLASTSGVTVAPLALALLRRLQTNLRLLDGPILPPPPLVVQRRKEIAVRRKSVAVAPMAGGLVPAQEALAQQVGV